VINIDHTSIAANNKYQRTYQRLSLISRASTPICQKTQGIGFGSNAENLMMNSLDRMERKGNWAMTDQTQNRSDWAITEFSYRRKTNTQTQKAMK
jgi:hypothetical protein